MLKDILILGQDANKDFNPSSYSEFKKKTLSQMPKRYSNPKADMYMEN